MSDHEKYVYALYFNLIGYYMHIALSNPIKAIEYFTKAKEIALTVDSYEYINFNITYQLFSVLLAIGEIEDAKRNMDELSLIYEIGLKNDGIEESEIMYLYNAKARLFLEQEKYQEALEQIDNCISVLKHYNLKATDNFLGVSYKQKIDALNELKRYQEAYSLASWIYKECKPSLPNNHELFAIINIKMSISQYGQKKYQAALIHANEVITILMRVRKIDPEGVQFTRDIQLAKALTIKADSLSALGNINQALEIYEKAEAIHNNIYVGRLNFSNSLKRILFEGTKTACKKSSELNKFWYKHFYGNLRSIFGINIPEIKEIEKVCPASYIQ